jgi:hypothetical protein
LGEREGMMREMSGVRRVLFEKVEKEISDENEYGRTAVGGGRLVTE